MTAMTKITAIIFFLPLVITNEEAYPPDPQYDITIPLINNLYEVPQALQFEEPNKLYAEWISQYQAPEIIQFSGTSAEFNIDKDTVSSLRWIYTGCIPEKYSRNKNVIIGVRFEVKNLGVQVILPKKNVKSTCQINLEYTFVASYNKTTSSTTNLNIEWYSNFNPVLIQNVKTCKYFDEEYELAHFRFADKKFNGLMEHFKRSSILHSLLKECQNLNTKFSNINEANHHVYSKPFYNVVQFPWATKYKEFVIVGLGNIMFVILNNDDESYNVSVIYDNATVLSNITSVKSQSNRTVNTQLALIGEFEKIAKKVKNIEITYNGKTENFISDGFKQTYQNRRYEVTTTFVNIIREMLQTIGKQITFKHSFENRTEIGWKLFGIADKLSSKLENVSCSFSYKKLEINTLNYNKITGNIEYQYQAINRSSVRVSAIVEMKNITIHLQQLLNKSKISETETNDEFSYAETTILMESQGFRRKDRCAVGKQISKIFVHEIKEQIKTAMHSYFHPIFSICKQPLGTIFKLYPNYKSNQGQHYILIRADWMDIVKPFSTRFNEIIINGSLIFESLNVGFVDEEVDFLDLRIKDVAGSFKQIDDASNETVKLLYNMTYFSITINQTSRGVQVKIPESANFSVTSNSNSSLIDEDKIRLREKFESSVAAFIQHSLYGDLKENREYKELANRTIIEALQKETEMLSKYDISSTFPSTIAKTLQSSYEELKNSVACQCQSSDDSLIHWEGAAYQMIMTNITLSTQLPITREEICLSTNNSHVTYHIVYQVEGNLVTNYTTPPCQFFFSITFPDVKIISKNITNDYQYAINEQRYIVTDPQECAFNISNEFLNETLIQKSISMIKRQPEDPAKYWFNAKNPLSNFCIFSNRPNWFDSNDDFYIINNTIDYTSQRFLMYHIKLYGLLNYKSLRFNNTGIETLIEFKMKNLNVHIIWNYLVDEFPLTKAKKMDFQIETITLKGKISSITNDLSFSDDSQLQVLHQTDPDERKNLEQSLKTVIVESIQQSIISEYNDEIESTIIKMPRRKLGRRFDWYIDN